MEVVQGSDGSGQVPLGCVQLFYVSCDLFHLNNRLHSKKHFWHQSYSPWFHFPQPCSWSHGSGWRGETCIFNQRQIQGQTYLKSCIIAVCASSRAPAASPPTAVCALTISLISSSIVDTYWYLTCRTDISNKAWTPCLACQLCHRVIEACKRLLCGEKLVDVLHHVQVGLKNSLV